MAATSRTEGADLDRSPLEQALHDDACSFEFFQGVTLLQRLLDARQPVGRFSNPESEAVHFRVNNQLAFPASQIHEIEWSENSPPQMAVNFMGLTGPLGVLPYCYTEQILDRLRAKDKALQSFLDIFHHRIISFFFRAWEKYRFPVTYDLGDEDLFTHHLLDLMGLGTPGLPDRQAVPDKVLLHFTGLLAKQTRSAAALEAILASYFEVPVEIEQFAGAWYRLDRGTQCRLDDNRSESQQLGCGAVVGDEIWNRQSRVRIKLGPLTLAQYLQFLPDGSAFAPLQAITKFFSNDEFEFEVQLILRRAEVPSCDVGVDTAASPRLGWVSWLKSQALKRDPEDTILNL